MLLRTLAHSVFAACTREVSYAATNLASWVSSEAVVVCSEVVERDWAEPEEAEERSTEERRRRSKDSTEGGEKSPWKREKLAALK